MLIKVKKSIICQNFKNPLNVNSGITIIKPWFNYILIIQGWKRIIYIITNGIILNIFKYNKCLINILYLICSLDHTRFKMIPIYFNLRFNNFSTIVAETFLPNDFNIET